MTIAIYIITLRLPFDPMSLLTLHVFHAISDGCAVVIVPQVNEQLLTRYVSHLTVYDN